MTPHELDADQLLGALGELQQGERSELAHLEQPARELAEREPERAQALEDRLMQELFSVEAAPAEAVATQPRRVARPRRFAQLAAAAGASCAVALGLLLWDHPEAGQPFEVRYTLEAPTPDAHTRAAGVAPEPGAYSLGRSLSFVLRPAERYAGPLRVSCYAAQQDAVVPLDAQVEHDPGGGARVVLSAAALTKVLRAGSYELLFYVARQATPEINEAQVRTRQCPDDTRCLTFSARFAQPEEL